MFIDAVGENARTAKIDRQMGSEYAKFKVATGLATSIFFYSFPATERRGISIQRLRVAFLREGIPTAIVGDALKKLEDIDGPLYLHFEKGLYYFSSQEDFIDDAMKTLEDDWKAVIAIGAIGIVTALYLIWDPLTDPAFNNFLLVISVACMAVQFAYFYILAHPASITMKH
jgi:hypothetical protein